MTALLGSVLCTNADSASFRAWTEFVHNQITGSGMLYIPVSGDIDFATVDAPATTNEKTGFKLYSFNDALQSTTPIYFRLDYGSGAATARPTIYCIIGFSHASGSIRHTGSLGDTYVTGAGKGIFIDEFVIGTAGTTATAHSHSWSGDGSFVMGALWWTLANSRCLFSLERTHDESGNSDGRGVIAVLGGNGVREAAVLYLDSGSGQTLVPTWSTIMGTRNPAAASGSTGTVIPISMFTVYGERTTETSYNLIAMTQNEFSQWKDIFVNLNDQIIPFRIYDSVFRPAADFTNGLTQALGLRFQD
jgi:hypothetical protein